MAFRVPQADPELLARARDGDMYAHASLYETFAPMVYTLARRMLASASLAEDVLQETFVEVIRKASTCRGDAEFGYWIRRIAVNKCLMHLRSSWHARRHDLSDDEPPAPSPGGHDEQLALERALAMLSNTARAVVLLHDVEGYTHEEIARMMGRTTSFSKSQLARAHDRLRTLLHDHAEPLPTDEPTICAPVLKTC